MTASHLCSVLLSRWVGYPCPARHQRYTAHIAVISTKADIEALRADVFKALTDQTWKLAGVVLAGMAFVVAALKYTP